MSRSAEQVLRAVFVNPGGRCTSADNKVILTTAGDVLRLWEAESVRPLLHVPPNMHNVRRMF